MYNICWLQESFILQGGAEGGYPNVNGVLMWTQSETAHKMRLITQNKRFKIIKHLGFGKGCDHIYIYI